MKRWMTHDRQGGQLTIEYLIITAAIIAGMVALSQATGCRGVALINTAVNNIPVR